MRRLLLAAALLAATPALARAQQPATTAATPAWPAAKPADVATLDAIIAALYASISGPPGQARDFERMKSLFHPTARMEPISTNPQTGAIRVAALSPDDYVQRSSEIITTYGFTEQELSRKVDRFGNLVHVWSTYAGRFTGEGAPVTGTMRGINSIQLAWDGTRFWILNLSWDAERPGLTLPKAYLPSR